MSPLPFVKLAALARRYPRRHGKKDSYSFRATNSESHIAFIPEKPAETSKRANGGRKRRVA